MNNSHETIIDLLRHGEPDGGELVFRGRTDDALTSKGWQQMNNTIGDHRHWDTIISSPALRCAEFSKKLSERLSVPLKQNEQLWELDLGEWDGKLFTEIQKDDPDLFTRFLQDPVKVTPPAGESLPNFQQRILQTWDSLYQENKGKHLLVIAHGGPIRIIIGHVLGIPLDSLLKLELPYAGISRIRIYSDDNHTTPVSSLVFHVGALS